MRRFYILLLICLPFLLGGTRVLTGDPQGGTIQKATDRDITLYVTVGGSDTNDCLSSGTACLTIQAAVDKVPNLINHNVLIDIGAGTFDGFAVANYTIGAITFTITGHMVESTLATGTATGTSTGGDTDTLVDGGQAWTGDDLVGRFVEVEGALHVIRSNDGTSLDLAGYHSATMSGKAYAIKDSDTIVQTPVAWVAALKVMNIQGGDGSTSYIKFNQLKFDNLTYIAIVLEGVSHIILDSIQIDTPTYWGFATYRSGMVTANEIYIGNPTWGGFLFSSTNEVYANGLMSDGDGTGSGWAAMTFTNITHLDSPALVAQDNGDGVGVEFSACKYIKIRRIIAIDNNLDGILIRSGSIAVKGGYAILLEGTGNGAFGVRASNDSTFTIGAAPTITGVSGDATINDGTTALAWATDFASDGDCVVNIDTGSRIERRD